MLIVDAYNVLHATGVLPPDLAGIDLPDLARLIAGSRWAGRPVRLVCDGPRPPGPPQLPPGIAADYSGAGREADDLIEQLLRQSSSPRSLTVVSSDRRVRGAARARRAHVLSSDEFLRRLAQDRSRRGPAPLPPFTQEIPLDPYATGYWMGYFGMEASSAGLSDPAAGPSPATRATAAGTTRPVRATQPRTTAGPPSGPHPNPVTPPSRAAIPPPPGSISIDPILLDALEEWAGRISLDDLNMEKWLTDSPSTGSDPRTGQRPSTSRGPRGC